jgi:hypothetical protein
MPLSLIISLSVVPFYLKFFTLDEYGYYLGAQAVLLLVGLLDISSTSYCLKKTSVDYFFDSRQSDRLLFSLLVYQIALACVISIVVISVFLVLDRLGIVKGVPLYVIDYFVLAGCTYLIAVIFGVNHSLLRSRRYLKFYNFTVFLVPALGHFMSFLFLLSGVRGIQVVGYGFLISTVLINLVIATRVNFIWKRVFSKQVKIKKTYVVNSIRFGLGVQVTRVVNSYYTALFGVLAISVLGSEFLARYNITDKLANIIPIVTTKLLSNFQPYFASYSESRQFPILVARYVSYLLLGVVVVSVLVFSFTYEFVSYWVGESMFVGQDIFYIIVFKFINTLFRTGIYQLVISTGVFGRLRIVSLTEIFLSFSGSIIAFYFFGFEVAIYMFFMPMFLTNLYLLLYLYNRYGISFCK